MSAAHEELIVDRVSDVEESEDDTTTMESGEKHAAVADAGSEREGFAIRGPGRYFGAQKQLDATQLYLNEIGFSPLLTP